MSRGYTVEIDKVANVAIIKVDLGSNLGPSSSGKTNLCANSGGFTPIGDNGFKLSLNVIRPKV